MKTIECGRCGNVAAKTTTTDFIGLEGCKIIIDNLPCYKCEECGEIHYTDDIVENIEAIRNQLKNDMGTIIFSDYEKCMKLTIFKK